MRTDGNTKSITRQLIHIGAVALTTVVIFGLIALLVAGKPAEASAPRVNFERQSVLPAQVVPVPAIEKIAQKIQAQPELMHDAVPTVPTQVETIPHRRIVKMVVTAYCPCAKCCGENAQGITASGKLVSHNNGRFVAADNSLPFGTKLVIPGYNNGSVEVLDRGGAIKGNRIDVFFPTHEEALQWGRQTLQVTILD